VTEARLTRAELAWLLAQEAHGAARALREEVSQLSPPSSAAPVDIRGPAVSGRLAALDDAISALTELEHPTRQSGRTRIDVASLIGSIAPQARMALEPGTGTEVFVDESELRRMLHVLLCPTSGGVDTVQSTAVDLEVRGEGDLVRVSVPLGPDRSATAELERRWLSRMALRHGGKLELSGSELVLSLPVGGSSAQQEVHALRRELEQAQQLGEAYARELAEVFATTLAPPRRAPAPSPTEANAPLEALCSVGSAIARRLLPALDSIHTDLEALRHELGAASALPRSLARHTSSVRELVAELARVSVCPLDEPAKPLDIEDLCKRVAAEAEGRAARHGVQLEVAAAGAGSLITAPGALSLLLRSLIDHAIAATPRDAAVRLAAGPCDGGVVLRCQDGGPAVPAHLRDDLLHHRVDPTSLGRPTGVALLIVAAAAAHLAAAVELADGDDGLVVQVTVPPRG
jgi:two-component system OmpR family sensor kinase